MTAENDIAVYLSEQSDSQNSVFDYAVFDKMVFDVVGSGTDYGTIGTDIFVDYKPADPDNVVCVFGYAGQTPRHTHDSEGEGRPGIQIWVRNKSAAAGRDLIEKIFTDLDGLANITINGMYYLGIFANQHPELMGKDENGRSEFSVNFSVINRRSE
jgi:hypothetical protein